MFKTLSLATSAAVFLTLAGCGSVTMPAAKTPAMLASGALVAPRGMTL